MLNVTRAFSDDAVISTPLYLLRGAKHPTDALTIEGFDITVLVCLEGTQGIQCYCSRCKDRDRHHPRLDFVGFGVHSGLRAELVLESGSVSVPARSVCWNVRWCYADIRGEKQEIVSSTRLPFPFTPTIVKG